MTNPIGSTPSIPPSFPQNATTPALAEQVRTRIVSMAQDLSQLLSDPSHLAHPEFISQVHSDMKELPELVDQVLGKEE